MTASSRFDRLPTAAKLLIILTLVMLPISLALAWMASNGIAEAKLAQRDRATDHSRLTAKAMESLLARNALALRVAANGALATGFANACERTRRSLSIAPAVAQTFVIDRADGTPACSIGREIGIPNMPLVAPGAIRVLIDERSRQLIVRIGVIDGMATAVIAPADLRAAAVEAHADTASLTLRDVAGRQLDLIAARPNAPQLFSEWPLAGGQIVARDGTPRADLAAIERLAILLPVLMWVAAAFISWLLVTRLLIRPLRRLETAVSAYQPGESELDLPDRLGPSAEIEQLRDSFASAIERIDHSEREMAQALEGQRRLVREVHHRVKNNLQVVASLLNIHGRSASSGEARAAYVAIGRRVGALSVVHRNHFAELEENRGIALRPLLSDLAAELRGSAPDEARGLIIDLEADSVYTTQDVAVAIAFLVTEMVEHAMLMRPADAVEIVLRRTTELTARLSVSSPVLNPDDDASPDKVQFERIVGGLAKQLRSPLERKLGRYSVEFPVFPPKN